MRGLLIGLMLAAFVVVGFVAGGCAVDLTLLTPAEEGALTLAEIKAHVRIDHTADDDLLTAYLAAAERLCETTCGGRQLVTATWQLRLDKLPSGSEAIELPRSPVQEVTSFLYTDPDGEEQELFADEDFVLQPQGDGPGLIVPAYGVVWPVARDHANTVTIEFVAGYGGAEDVPASIKAALNLAIADWYRDRERPGMLCEAAQRLLLIERVGRVA